MNADKLFAMQHLAFEAELYKLAADNLAMEAPTDKLSSIAFGRYKSLEGAAADLGHAVERSVKQQGLASNVLHAEPFPNLAPGVSEIIDRWTATPARVHFRKRQGFGHPSGAIDEWQQSHALDSQRAKTNLEHILEPTIPAVVPGQPRPRIADPLAVPISQATPEQLALRRSFLERPSNIDKLSTGTEQLDDPLATILQKYPEIAHKTKVPHVPKPGVVTGEHEKRAAAIFGLLKAADGVAPPGAPAVAAPPTVAPAAPVPAATNHRMRVSDAEARAALKQLDQLDQSKPGLNQLGRYAAIGATAAPVIGMVGSVIQGRPILGRTPGAGTRQQIVEMMRGAAADAAKGALGAGVIPLIRHRSDINAQMDTLKDFIAERQQKLSMQTPRARLAIEQRNMTKPDEAARGKGIGSIARISGTGSNLPGTNNPKQGL